jgi:hypothetical protein
MNQGNHFLKKTQCKLQFNQGSTMWTIFYTLFHLTNVCFFMS